MNATDSFANIFRPPYWPRECPECNARMVGVRRLVRYLYRIGTDGHFRSAVLDEFMGNSEARHLVWGILHVAVAAEEQLSPEERRSIPSWKRLLDEDEDEDEDLAPEDPADHSEEDA